MRNRLLFGVIIYGVEFGVWENDTTMKVAISH
jgi:hypothetical protein